MIFFSTAGLSPHSVNGSSIFHCYSWTSSPAVSCSLSGFDIAEFKLKQSNLTFQTDIDNQANTLRIEWGCNVNHSNLPSFQIGLQPIKSTADPDNNESWPNRKKLSFLDCDFHGHDIAQT